ncbi:MAG TPA: cytochrome P450 [Gaiellaceae bacterium]|nr:cytochrome P450 [Gaiellaceae bacterium]
MSATAAAAPPAARRRRSGFAELARFAPDPLRYVDGFRGDPRPIVPFTLGRLDCRLVTEPELIGALLDTEVRPPVSRGRIHALQAWYNGGLLLAEGDEHDRQRDEVWAPALAATKSLPIAIDRTERRLDTWRPGEPIDVFPELGSLTGAIDWQALTGEDLDARPELLAAQRQGVSAMLWLLGPYGTKRWNLPLPPTLATKRAKRTLDGAIDELIAARRAAPTDDVLSVVVAHEPDDVLARAVVKQWLTADQVHVWLTWALYALATHPDVAARWHAELDSALDGRAPAPDDVAALPYTRAVLKETLRLWPPIWMFFRGFTGDFELGGETIHAGELVAVSQWLTHRDPRFWPDPERFDPDRFADGAEQPPPVSYFPFSTGPYGCNAYHLSTYTAVLVLAAIGRRFELRADASRPAQPQALNVVVPKGGLRLTPVER